MSKFQKIVTELKKFLADIPQPEAFAVTADDLVISELKVGGKVEAKDADNNVIPAPDGEYKVGEDMIVVKDGFITSLNGKTEAEPTEQMADEIPAPETNDLQVQVDAMAKDIEELKAQVAEMKTKMSAVSDSDEKFSSQLQELNESMKLLMSMPAEFSKTNESIEVKESKDEKLLAAAKLFAKKNK